MFRFKFHLLRPMFQIKVIVGDDRETTGHLLSIDGLEGVVKTDSNDIKLYHLSHLCKLSG